MSKKRYEINSAQVGEKFIIPKWHDLNGLRAGVYEKSKVPYWAFPSNHFVYVGNSKNYYLRVLLVSRGEKCWVKPGDWVEMTSCKGIVSKLGYNSATGGAQIFLQMECTFKPCIREEKGEDI